MARDIQQGWAGEPSRYHVPGLSLRWKNRAIVLTSTDVVLEEELRGIEGPRLRIGKPGELP